MQSKKVLSARKPSKFSKVENKIKHRSKILVSKEFRRERGQKDLLAGKKYGRDRVVSRTGA